MRAFLFCSTVSNSGRVSTLFREREDHRKSAEHIENVLFGNANSLKTSELTLIQLHFLSKENMGTIGRTRIHIFCGHCNLGGELIFVL